MKKALLMVIALILTTQVNAAKEVIASGDAPKAIGPYSQAIKVDNVLYLAGQIPLDPKTGKLASGGIEKQTRQVMANIQAVLSEAGYSFDDVVQTQIYLTNLNHYGTVNKIYAEYFDQAPPARAVVEVSRLPKESMIEVMMTAAK